jgi:lipopolysaccharide export system permease protein
VLRFAGYLDSSWAEDKSITPAANFEQLLPDSAITRTGQNVKSIAGSLRISEESFDLTMKAKDKNLRKHKIEWHRKIVLSLACMILFLIGAPLGSIIRKGGLGTPLILAIVFFMLFYFASTTGEKAASADSLTPFTGMWLATFILLPAGIFLTYKATHDSQLFNKEYYRRIRKIFRK